MEAKAAKAPPTASSLSSLQLPLLFHLFSLLGVPAPPELNGCVLSSAKWESTAQKETQRAWFLDSQG